MGRGQLTAAAMALFFGIAGPAAAGTAISIPEPTDLTLLALGLAGLIIGRRGAKRPPQDQD